MVNSQMAKIIYKTGFCGAHLGFYAKKFRSYFQTQPNDFLRIKLTFVNFVTNVFNQLHREMVMKKKINNLLFLTI